MGIIFDLIMYLLFKKYDTSGEQKSSAVFIPFEDGISGEEGMHEVEMTNDYFPEDDFNDA